jgi:hypothetical protein
MESVMKKTMLLFALVFVFCSILIADISEYYEFQAGTTTYTEITGTQVTAAMGDDVLSGAIDIGFTFTYGMNTYTQIKISSNGYVALGAPTTETRSNALNSTTYVPVVAALWDDLHTGRVAGTTYLQTSSVQYLLQGTAPNRTFTVQYKYAYWYYSVATSWVNFQIVLKENGSIEFNYGPNAGVGPGTSASASIGINMLPGGASNYWSVSPTTGTASNTAENSTINAYIPNGTKYSFNVPAGVPNDLSALSITGSTTPSVGNPATYTINVRNRGTLEQATYSVKLMSGTTELASVNGTAIQPATTLPVQVTWTPTIAGSMQVYGKVVLAGDENPTNDQTAPLDLNVQPEGTNLVIIGNGTATQRQPFGIFFGYERDAALYTQDQIGIFGNINSIEWYCATTSTNAAPYFIYLKTTTNTALTAQPWATMVADAQLVASGTQTFSQTGWTTFQLDTPYLFAGGNLVVLVQTEFGGNGISPYPYFRYTTGATGSHQYWAADTNPPSGNGTLTTNLPNIGLFMSAASPDPTFAVSPPTWNFGQIIINTVNNKTFNITNIGGGTTPLVINSIAITGSPFFTLQNLPTLPASLASFQTTTFVVRYNPTSAGNHTATVVITDNLTRTQHPVDISATCFDPTIYISPYVQNFDAITAPILPPDWFKLATGSGNVTTSTTSPYSAPNSVYIYNSSDISGPYLISPPLAAALPVNNMRVKFWARGGTNYSLSVGVMNSITDAATYSQVSSLTLTSAWTEYVVSFVTYAGTGNFIAFKHGNAGTFQGIYIDNVTIEVIPQNDLAALTVTGNATPSVGMASEYTINLFNWGTNPQSAYTVKLYKEGDVEVGTIAGPTINPGMTGQAQITWIPSTQGVTYLYGKVELEGDQNSLNDQTSNLSVSVQAAGTLVVTIGDGSQNARMPLDMFYRNSLYENIYFSSELNFTGMITGISLYNNFLTYLPDKPTKIWMGTTTLTDLSAGWIPSTSLTSVFDGNVTYPSGLNTITITFPTPFLYLEGNLVVMFNRPMDTAFFNSSDYFKCQTVGTNRARNSYDDTTVFDPANPSTTDVTVSGQFPKTSFFVIPGGVGHLTGTVYGAGNIPLEGATVQILNGVSATTNPQGIYQINNILAGDYQVTCSRFGYISQTVNVTIPEDITVTQNFNLVQMSTVNVIGRIVGSDFPEVGIDGAIIQLSGYDDYNATTNAQGEFTIPGVYASQTYQYIASAVGYQAVTGSINVGTVNYDMGTIVVNEFPYVPRNVIATQAADQQSVTVNWLAPDPNSVDITQGFEDTAFPPTDWTRIVTNNGPANTSGVYPTWCRVGTVTSGTDTVTPVEGSWQAGLWWDFNHQDEWLITPQFICPPGAFLSFSSYYFRGSQNGDHYYVQITTNNGSTWTPLWDASALTGGVSNYEAPIQLDLSAYAGQQVKLAWHADDAPSNDGMWYVWFIDQVMVGTATQTIRFPESAMTVKSASMKQDQLNRVVPALPLSKSGERAMTSSTLDTNRLHPLTDAPYRHRPLQGYKVWRLVSGQEQNEATWSLVTTQIVTTPPITDNGWESVTPGTYKWAVKAYYGSEIYSLAAFSNVVVKQNQPGGTLLGIVRSQNNIPIMGAVITAGAFTTTTNASGSYTMPINVGTYAVTCTATNYEPQTNNNVVIIEGQNTICNFILNPVSNADEVVIAQTVLKGNFPNPFNPQTIISYDIKDKAAVRIDIFNLKGQLIRTLVNGMIDKGNQQVIWNGTDANGNPVASGVYQYRMQAGDYKSVRRMMLIK